MSALNSTNSIKQVPFWIAGQIYSWNYSIHLNALRAELNLAPKVHLENNIHHLFSYDHKVHRHPFIFIIVFKDKEKFIVT